MDRTKFKKCLNEMDSNQRTALLYLENYLIETRKKIASPTESQIQLKQFNETKNTVKDNSEKINTSLKYMKEFNSFAYDLSKRSLDLEELMCKYGEEVKNMRKMIGILFPQFNMTLLDETQQKEFVEINNAQRIVGERRMELEKKLSINNQEVR